MSPVMNAGQRLPGTPEPMHLWPGYRDVNIAGDSWGNPEDPLVVLLHGAGQTRHAWRRTGERLGAAKYYAISLDSRGHGDSDWSAEGLYGREAQVEDLVSVLEALDRPHPVLVGASMGGGISLGAIGEGRVNALALVLVDMAPRLEPTGTAKIRDFMAQRPEGFDSLDEVADAIANYQPHRTRPRSSDGLAKNVRLGENGKYHWHWDPKTRIGLPNAEERRLRLEECARGLRIPTLLVRGGLSDVLTEEGAQSFLELCPHAEYVNVTDAAHMVAGDSNNIFSDAIIEFLWRNIQRVDSTAPPRS